MLKFLFVAAFLFFQAPDPHQGQPATCNNYAQNTHPCNCHRATKCARERQGEPEDSRCQTYCRKEACKCLDPCTT